MRRWTTARAASGRSPRRTARLCRSGPAAPAPARCVASGFRLPVSLTPWGQRSVQVNRDVMCGTRSRGTSRQQAFVGQIMTAILFSPPQTESRQQWTVWLQGGMRGAVAPPKKPWQLLVPGGPWPPPTPEQQQPPTQQQSPVASQAQPQPPQQPLAQQPQPQPDAPGPAAAVASQTATAAPTVRDQVSGRTSVS